jgi:peptidoglycan/xylan/chitin deacetylase (PgdA/CDA1 family)
MRILLKFTGIAVTLIIVIALGLFHLSKARNFQLFGGLVSHVETDDQVVALTFDDAPGARTPDVLGILTEKAVPATFYMVGESLEAQPEQGRSIVAQGHELGNHSYSHQRFLLQSRSFIRHEVDTTNRLIREAGHTGPITFRPPYGKKLFGLPRYLRSQDITTVMWDVEPDTFHAGDADAMTQYALEHTKPGSIILLHPFCETQCAAAREALPRIIDGLRAKGFRFVKVSELLQR